MEHIRVTSKGSIGKAILLFLLLGTVFIAAVNLINLDMQKFFERLENVPDVLSRMMAVDFSIVPDALLNIVTSLALALLTLVVAVFLAMFLSFLAASNIAPNRYVAIFIKGFFAIVRSVPSLVWGLMVIASLGFGNVSGFIAILISAVGYLVKTFTGSIEESGGEIIEAMKATGASWFKIVYHGLIPLCITAFVAWITVCFEMNVSESIGLGMIGVGGIGLLLTQAINTYNYAQTTTIVIMICILMVVLEFVMTRIKNNIKFGNR
ncbi:PhnE/PtxC family ABC transporter permease [Metabacillus halosaccharovorans]|uniref:PhnE/PtxC family ABC transporter permease n=1 Tax=Metabacillus halosaccharovorans TaxID=930124 RepID=UPI000995811B|nr:ABC transporter permease subunit [Metabacillus halosaccharovorans]